MTFDPARLAFETVWSDAAWDHLSGLLFALPVEWRFFMKHQVFAEMAQDGAAAADPIAAVAGAFRRAAARHPQIGATMRRDAA
jgi:N-methylhydantoinase B